MAIEKVKSFFAERGMLDRVMDFDVSSATVELAAKALNVKPELIAKTLSFKAGDRCILIVLAGDVKVDNHKYKGEFGIKAKFLTREEASELVGHVVGGVCPFAVNEGVEVYIDESVKRFEYVYPACGSTNSAVKLTPEELYKLSGARKWVNVSIPVNNYN